MGQSDAADHEFFYRLMTEQSPDVIIRYNLDGLIEYCSPAARNRGIDPERVVGRNVGVFVAPEDRERHKVFMAALAAGEFRPGEPNVWRVPGPDGRIVAWEGLTCPMRRDGRMVGAMSVLRDVTHRLELEEALAQQRAEVDAAFAQLQESEARYRLLADHGADMIVQYDMGGVIEYVSPAVRRLLGYDPAELVGRIIGSVGEVEPHVTHDFLQEVRRGELPPRGRSNEFEITRADGVRIWLQGNPTLLRDGDGAPIAVITQLRDVTERRKLEAELEARREEAEAAVAAKAEFLANMSHEIRTPLTAVVGFAGLLSNVEGLPPKARRHADLIGRAGEALTTIVNNVLDFSKIEAGQVQLKTEPTSPARLIRETVDVLEHEATAKGLSVAAEGLDALPAAVQVDPTRLRQVLLNLLANAVKFTHAGGITVAARHDLALGELRIEVRDTGIGIPEDLSARLFQRFSQIESSNARRFGGTGLGLAISKALVQMMGGEIGVESREGEGARFWFTLSAPAVKAAPAGEDAAQSPQLAPCRILVVDDARPNRELISALLSAHPVTVVEAANGLEAVAAAAREAFDVILMDLQMPEMDGVAAGRAIRNGERLNRDTPILAVSASVLDADVEACRDAGMNDHVPKPIDPGELIAKIARFSGPRRGRPTRRAAGRKAARR